MLTYGNKNVALRRADVIQACATKHVYTDGLAPYGQAGLVIAISTPQEDLSAAVPLDKDTSSMAELLAVQNLELELEFI